MNPSELAAAVAATAITIANNTPTEDLLLLGSVFVQLGETLETIAVQREYLSRKCGENRNKNETI